MNEYFPEDTLAKCHQELFHSVKLESFMVAPDIDKKQIKEIKEALEWAGCKFRSIQYGSKGAYCYYYAPDNAAKDRALDKAYKLRGLYSNENKDVNILTSIQMHVAEARLRYSE